MWYAFIYMKIHLFSPINIKAKRDELKLMTYLFFVNNLYVLFTSCYASPFVLQHMPC